MIWVGAGTKDTGLSFTRLTFQVTHATDSDANAERDYIVSELLKVRAIEDVTRTCPPASLCRLSASTII